MQEDQKQYATNDKRQANVQEKDDTRCMNSEANDVAHLNEDKAIVTEQEVKVVDESLRSLSFCDKMRGLQLHRRPLKDRMRDKMVSYIDLLRPGPPPLKKDNGTPKRLATRKQI